MISMMEFFEKKIAEIREKPESVRIMYVWGMVASVMVLVVFIWIFTLRENLASAVPSSAIDSSQDTIQRKDTQVGGEKPSLQESFGAEGVTGASK